MCLIRTICLKKSFQFKRQILNVQTAMMTQRNLSFDLKEHITTINNYTINYTVVGNGKHNLLLLPGAMGTMQSDFAPQFSGLDQEKYTLISWDPIGYGKSRPPQREFMPDFYVNDAKVVGALMNKLDRRQYSVLGWSDGAITAIILAALHPDNLHRAVLLAPMAYVTKEDVAIYQGLKDISQWTPQLRQKLEAVYGAEYLTTLWTNYCQYFEDTLSQRDGEVCRKYLSQVKCPTLVLHGELDPVVPLHHGEYVARHIQSAEYRVIKKGRHNFHYKFSDKINSMIDDFLSKPEDLGATGIVNL
ncbi:valacyclovir hydrolase-like [Macrosteles quadrilineatus]|uniref:valacyclovir hydrolase-like n=1 Tax=Macrosteles quadrilineatus TaxID=74068 RepID=UPI0023E298E1|nr:valacyclovir hydrolase-like [Macrosteles quadrilineatus]